MHVHRLLLLALVLVSLFGAGASTTSGAPSNVPAEQIIGLHPVLGVQIDTNAQTDGLLVDAVMPGSIAARMGLVPGDILLEVNGATLASIEVLHSVLSRLRHGDNLVVAYRHGSEQLEKKDNLEQVPVLPTYEVLEGRGIPGVIEIGFTREQLEKSLGKPLGEQEDGGMTVLAYPFHGLTVALIEGGGQKRVMQFGIEYPLVCRTSRGVVTGAERSTVEAAYKGQALDTRVLSGRLTVDTLPRLGIQFRSMQGRITRTVVIPIQTTPPSPSP